MIRIVFKRLIQSFITISFFFTSIFIPLASAQTCPRKTQGDADCNGSIDLLDFETFRSEFILARANELDITQAKANFNGDSAVDLLDFEIFRTGYHMQQPTQTTTATNPPTKTPTATPTPTSTGTITPTGTLPPISGTGIWISKDEIMKLPMSGGAWDSLNAAANSTWGAACLNDNNCPHDVNTLAGALVAVRTNNNTLREKVIAGIQSAMKSSTSRTLELARGLQAYPIAADIIGYRSPEFEAWLKDIQDRSIPGRLGNGLYANAIKDSTNWGGHERAAAIAVNLYLKDTTRLKELARAYREYIGENVSPKTLQYEGTNWHADSNNKAGVNRKGAIIQGKNVSGVLPEDWRRATGFQWPPALTGYMWEGMQGFVVSAVLLHRANLVPFNAGDSAVIRAMNMLYGTGEAATNSPVFKNPASGDDTWIPWVINYYGGTTFPTQSTSAGKNMGWTDWMYGK